MKIFQLFFFVLLCSNLLLTGQRAIVHHCNATTNLGNSSFVDDAMVNRDPNAFVFLTTNSSSGIFHPHHTGVWYDPSRGKWGIFNQDMVNMPIMLMNVAMLSARQTTAEGTFFLHQAIATTIVGNSTYLDSVHTNQNPQAKIIVTPNWNPNQVYHNHAIGVWYNSSMGKWAIFNQDMTPMSERASFNVYVTTNATVHRATTATHRLYLDIPSANGNNNAVLLITQNWNPNGQGGVYNNQSVGVLYDRTQRKWVIANQNGSLIPQGSAFNVLALQIPAPD